MIFQKGFCFLHQVGTYLHPSIRPVTQDHVRMECSSLGNEKALVGSLSQSFISAKEHNYINTFACFTIRILIHAIMFS